MAMMSPVHTFPTDISLADILCFDLLLLLYYNNNNIIILIIIIIFVVVNFASQL